MTIYEVEALGRSWTTEAESESEAHDTILQRVKEEYDASFSANAIKAYDVRFKLDNTRANVLASTHVEAAENARQWVERKLDRAIKGSNQDAREILQELSTDVEVKGVSPNTHYEIDRDGRWNEGDLEDVDA